MGQATAVGTDEQDARLSLVAGCEEDDVDDTETMS